MLGGYAMIASLAARSRPHCMNAKQALAWVKKCGIAMESARASIPSLARVVAGETMRGSWWAHPKGNEIFLLSRAIRRSPDILVCRLVEGKITYVHRRLWPALVRCANRFPRARLAAITEVHTQAGKHRVLVAEFPAWVPQDVLHSANQLTEQKALAQLSIFGAVMELKEHHLPRVNFVASGSDFQ